MRFAFPPLAYFELMPKPEINCQSRPLYWRPIERDWQERLDSRTRGNFSKLRASVTRWQGRAPYCGIGAHRAHARRERAEKLKRASIGPERGDHFGRAKVFRPLAPSAATTETARGGGTAKRRARRSRGRYSFPARVAASSESRAGRPRVRRAPEAPTARRFPVP